MKRLTRLAILGGVLLAGWVAPPAGLRAQPRPEPERPAKGGPAGENVVTAEQAAFFEKSVRPVLVRECYSCHAKTAEKVRGGLLLDTREGLRKGGDSGPA